MPDMTYVTFDLKHHKSLNFEFSYNDDETTFLHHLLNGSENITENELRRVALWKLNRVLSVSEETLEKLNKLSKERDVTLRDPCVKEVIESLVNSQGIGFPMASAILKFVNPTIFPIIDVRAYRSLKGKKLLSASYTYEVYLEYAERLHELSKELGRPLKEIDEQLYCFDKEFNGKI